MYEIITDYADTSPLTSRDQGGPSGTQYNTNGSTMISRGFSPSPRIAFAKTHAWEDASSLKMLTSQSWCIAPLVPRLIAITLFVFFTLAPLTVLSSPCISYGIAILSITASNFF